MSKSFFVCPVCREPLTREEKSCRCPKGHSYDPAASGYLNLLLPNQKNSQEPGDDQAMVAARSRFLQKGYYAPLRDRLAALCLDSAPARPRLLDLGCGEGYYTAGVAQALLTADSQARAAGVDISKAAVKLASRHCKAAEFAAASVFRLPVADGCADLLLNCFSPLCLPEILRALAPGGYFLYVVPGARHLWGLKTALYREPYPNEEKETPYQGLEYRDICRVEGNIAVSSKEDIRDLFQMTPYAWKTSREDQEKLDRLDWLETSIAFDIHVYRKQLQKEPH